MRNSFGVCAVRLEPRLGETVTTSSTGFRILRSQDTRGCSSPQRWKRLKRPEVRNSRALGRESGLRLKQERLQSDLR